MQETHENVTIKEISGTELSRIGDDQKQYEWTFEVTVSVREQNGIVIFKLHVIISQILYRRLRH